MSCCCRPAAVEPLKDELGNTYTGSKNIKGQRHGAGKLLLADGRVFAGHFKNGKANKGLLTYPNGDTFDGSISYTFLPVNGVMTWNSGPNRGCIYKGPFSPITNVPHGPRGIMVSSNQTIYDGPFHNNLKHGIGIVAYPDAHPDFVRFEGVFVNNYINGRGTMQYRDGSRYEGGFTGILDRPKRQGRGRTDYANGDYYVGGYVNDLRQGTGLSKYVAKSSNKRRKSFHGNMPPSAGQAGTDSDAAAPATGEEASSSYSGASTKSGSTSATASTRRRSFDGSVKVPAATAAAAAASSAQANKTSGRLGASAGKAAAPTLAASDSTTTAEAAAAAKKQYTYEGQWSEDKRHGRGRETLPSGGYYDGEWEDDLRHGRGEYMYPDRRLYNCVYKQGVQSGMVMKADGSVKVSKMKESRRDSCAVS